MSFENDDISPKYAISEKIKTPDHVETDPDSLSMIKKAKSCPKKRVFKVIIVGNAGVGKTCLSFRFCNGRFPEHTEATIGVDFRERSVFIDGELIRIQLWDTAGQERFRHSMTTHYYRNIHAVIFVYDVSDFRSFCSLPRWIDECRRYSSSFPTIPRILIGNKCDRSSLEMDEARIFADSNDMPLFETSALDDLEAGHVESIFMTLVYKLKASKEMHVQSEGERSRNRDEHPLVLRMADQVRGEEDKESGWCC